MAVTTEDWDIASVMKTFREVLEWFRVDGEIVNDPHAGVR